MANVRQPAALRSASARVRLPLWKILPAAIVLYGACDQVRTALASGREKDRRALLAQIVTFRAELKKERLRNEQPRSPPGVAAKAF